MRYPQAPLPGGETLTPPNSLSTTGFAAVVALSSAVPASSRRPFGATPVRNPAIASADP
jgi:hypothetical protein